MVLHVNYETVEPFALERIETHASPKKKAKTESLFDEIVETAAEIFIVKPRTKLKADKANGVIEIETKTQLTGVPAIA